MVRINFFVDACQLCFFNSQNNPMVCGQVVLPVLALLMTGDYHSTATYQWYIGDNLVIPSFMYWRVVSTRYVNNCNKRILSTSKLKARHVASS